MWARESAEHAGRSTWILGWSSEERCTFTHVLGLADQVLGTRERVGLALQDMAQPWWERSVRDLPYDNLAVQPLDRGSAAGVLLAFLRTIRRHPFAQVMLVPNEAKFQAEHLRLALDAASDARGPAHGRVLVVPEPGASTDGGPAALGGRALAIASSNTLLRLFQRTQPELLQTFLQHLAGPALFDAAALDRFYPFLPKVELGRGVLAEADELVEVRDLDTLGVTWSLDAVRAHPVVRLLTQLEA